MMRFLVRHVRDGCRLGQITEVTMTTKCLDTPMCMLYSRAGSVPYMGRDVLDRIEAHPGMVNMPLGLLAENHEIIAEFPGQLKKFSAMNDFLVYCSIQDPAMATPCGYNIKNSVAIWGRGGKFELNVANYTKMMSGLGVDWLQSLADSDTDRSSTHKRVRKSVNRTLEYLDDLLQKQDESTNPEGDHTTQLIGTIEGGFLLDERLRSATETAERPVAGFTVEGFHNFGKETEKFDLREVQDLLEKTLEVLPRDKPRILPGIMDPANLLTAIRLGFDIFDSSYVYLVSERGCALCYSYQLLPAEGAVVQEASTTEKSGWEMDLNDKRHSEELIPVVSGCTCYTCTHHTRAYIHHLLNVSELLAQVLLNIHNLHHYLRTFEEIRRSLEDDKFTKLQKHILDQNIS